jgi:cytidylate kinase
MRIVLLGPPGSGKGTQAALLAQALGVPAVSTGELFRAHIAAGTELGRTAAAFASVGDLVADDVTTATLVERLEQRTASADTCSTASRGPSDRPSDCARSSLPGPRDWTPSSTSRSPTPS